MQTEKQITKDEVKLDRVLSLILHAQENELNLLSLFHARYGSLFYGELERLENILFEDGLVQYAVSWEGLEIGITSQGLDFLTHGGYGSDMIRSFQSSPEKPRITAHFRNYLMLAGFFFILLCCFVIFNKKG